MQEREAAGFGFIAGSWPLDPARATLVFIHGAGGTSNTWTNQVEALADRVNTVALDLPGHGRSRGPGRDKVSDYAKAVVQFMNEIGAPAPVPVGLSMGGAVTQQVLLDHPKGFCAAVLVSTGARLRVLPLIFDTIKQNFPAYVELMAKFSASPKSPRELIQPALDETARQKPEVVAADFRACDAFDVRDRLAEIATPVLVVTAEEDQLTPPKYGEFLARNIKWTKRIHLKDSGHLIPLEKPAELNHALLEFLDERGL
jgi:pimeloyl-ACP methyl ester carboxylesterase